MSLSYWLKQDFVTFCQELQEIIKDKHLITLELLLQCSPEEKILKLFEERVIPYREKITKREEEFFLKDDRIFDSLNKDNIFHFKNVWLSTLDSSEKDAIWMWFNHFIKFYENEAYRDKYNKNR
jgi:hypothetical protein